jgi:phage replication-related protein YjqB (UPF0714/DUF867 family)
VAYTSWAELEAAEVEGVDYAVNSTSPPGATWASIAIHGGGIERASSEVAEAVAGTEMAFYELDGLKTSGNSALHITSTLYDEPTCLALVAASQRTLSFHGYVGDVTVAETAIGGLDTELRDRVRHRLELAGHRVTDAPSEIAGTNPANICNKNARSAGVQLEMSRALRESFFPNGDLTRASRKSGQRTDEFHSYVAAVQSAYEGEGLASLGTANVSRWTLLPVARADVDVAVTFSTDSLAAGGPQFLALTGRWADVNNNYLLRCALNADQSITLTLRRRLSGTETLLATHNSLLTHTVGERLRMRLQVAGSTLRGRIWDPAMPEPAGWQVATTDTGITAAGSAGMRSILSSAYSGTLPVVAAYSRWHMASPQVMTVERSVNGIIKAHDTGADIRLAEPAIVAL